LVPVGIVLIALSHWLWTLHQFMSPDRLHQGLEIPILIIALGFISISISMAGMGQATPIASIIYLVVLWFAFFYHLYGLHIGDWAVLLCLAAAIANLLWAFVHAVLRESEAERQRSSRDLMDVLEMREAAEREHSQKEAMHADLARKSDFFNCASHDFRQRLEAFKMMTWGLTAGLPTNDPGHQTLGRLVIEVEQLQAYITNVLDFARMESGVHDPRTEQIDIQQLFQRLALVFESVAARRGVQLKFRATLLRISANPAMLERCLQNLVDNALRATRKRVLVCARRVGGMTAIDVIDQGSGIPESMQAGLFEPFSRSSGHGGGSGLGLSIVKRFTEIHGYSLFFETREGRGTRFRVLTTGEKPVTL
jgi:signal transduction histidine kinase